MPEIFYVASIGKGLLAVMPRPGVHEPLQETFRALAARNVNVVVSLLEADEARDVGLADERVVCESAGIEFRSFPIRDRGLPSDPAAVARFTAWAHTRITEGGRWVFHCHASIGRSGMMAASGLLREGWSVRDAFARISEARGLTVPDTPGQLEWLEEHFEILVRSAT